MKKSITSKVEFITIPKTKKDRNMLAMQPEGIWVVKQYFPNSKKRGVYRFFNEQIVKVVISGTKVTYA